MAAWVRSASPSLARMLETWLLTVSSVTDTALEAAVGHLEGRGGQPLQPPRQPPGAQQAEHEPGRDGQEEHHQAGPDQRRGDADPARARRGRGDLDIDHAELAPLRADRGLRGRLAAARRALVRLRTLGRRQLRHPHRLRSRALPSDQSLPASARGRPASHLAGMRIG